MQSLSLPDHFSSLPCAASKLVYRTPFPWFLDMIHATYQYLSFTIVLILRLFRWDFCSSKISSVLFIPYFLWYSLPLTLWYPEMKKAHLGAHSWTIQPTILLLKIIASFQFIVQCGLISSGFILDPFIGAVSTSPTYWRLNGLQITGRAFAGSEDSPRAAGPQEGLL